MSDSDEDFVSPTRRRRRRSLKSTTSSSPTEPPLSVEGRGEPAGDAVFGKDRKEAVDDDGDDDEGFGPLRAAFEGCAPPATTATETCAAADLLENESDLPNFNLFGDCDFGTDDDEGNNVGGQEEEGGRREEEPSRAEGGVSPATNRMDAEPAAVSRSPLFLDDEEDLAVEDSQQPQSLGTAVLISDDDDDDLLVQPFNGEEARRESGRDRLRRASRECTTSRAPEGAEAKDVVADSEEEDVCFGRRRSSGRIAGAISAVLVEEDDDGVAIEGEKVVIESGNEEEEEDYGGGWDGEEDLIVMDNDGDGCEKVAPRAHPSSRPPFSPSKRVMSSPPQEQRSPLASVRGVRSSLSSFSPIPMFAASRASAPGLATPSSPVDRPAGGHDDYSWMDRLPHYTPISVLERSYGRSGDPVYVQYKQQFAYKRGAAGDGSDGEEDFVQEPTSRGKGKGKGKGKKGGAQKGGHSEEVDEGNSYWITQGGRPAFVTASQVLTGAKAYKAYGKTKKGKAAAARKKAKR